MTDPQSIWSHRCPEYTEEDEEIQRRSSACYLQYLYSLYLDRSYAPVCSSFLLEQSDA